MIQDSDKQFTLREKLLAHIETMRPYTVIWSGLVSLAGACIAYGGLPPMRTAILVLFIPMLGWTAGLYLSDYLDRQLDAIQKPHRPIPSGRIQPHEALIIGAFFAIVGSLLSLLLNLNNVLLVFIVAGLVLAYARYTKSRGVWGHLTRGVITVTAYLYGVSGAVIALEQLPQGVWFFSIIFLIHDSTSNLVGAIRDIEGDRKGGYQTIPVRYGERNSFIIALFFTIVYVILTIIFVIVFDLFIYPIRFALLFALVLGILILLFVSIFRSIKSVNRRMALRAHEFFIAERITLASSFIIGIVSQFALAFLLYILAICVTLIAQYLIRSQYEFVPSS